MKTYRNSEGYHDPTASEAIRNAYRFKKKQWCKNRNALTYRLCEVQGFSDANKAINRKR